MREGGSHRALECHCLSLGGPIMPSSDHNYTPIYVISESPGTKVSLSYSPHRHHGQQQGPTTPAAVAPAAPGPCPGCEGSWVWPK